MIVGRQVWQRESASAGELTEHIARVWNIFDLQVPVGYQDDTGFHFGEQAAPYEFEI